MLKRLLFSGLTLAVIASAPIVYFTASDFGKSLRQKWFAGSDKAGQGGTDHGLSADALADQPAGAGALKVGPEGAPVHNLAEILRFDVTVNWIMQRWPRVSTGLAQLKLQGYRVPLVTGTAESDLAGSLTYYFNPQQRVQRITFHGSTGDASHLVMLLTTRYKFTRRLTNSPGLFIYEAVSPENRPQGVLKITSAPVIEAGKPHQRFSVDLVLDRPSEEATRNPGRWL